MSESKKTNKAGIVIYNSELSEEEVFHWASFDEHNIKDTALYLDKLILGSTKSDLPDSITLDSLAEPSARPVELVNFFRYNVLIHRTGDVNEHTEQQANFMADDVIYITTWGRSKHGKHLCLELGLSCE